DGQQALLYGPIVLAGRLGTAGLTKDTVRAVPTKPRTIPEYALEGLPAPALRVASGDPGSWVSAVSPGALEVKTSTANGSLSLAPLFSVFDERYAVYWKVAREGTPSS